MMETHVKDYLNAVCAAQITPIEVFMKTQEDAEYYYLIDVRIGPDEMLGKTIAGAKRLPLDKMAGELAALPKSKKIAVATWNSDCTLAKRALLILDGAGFDCVEIAGGVASWQNSKLPMA